MSSVANHQIWMGRWKQFRGRGRQLWGRFRGDRKTLLAGRMEELIGVAQSRYGYSRLTAEKHIDRLMRNPPFRHQ